MVVSNHVFDTILYTINLQNIKSCFYNIKYTILNSPKYKPIWTIFKDYKFTKTKM